MKRLHIFFSLLFLSCFCSAQDNGLIYPSCKAQKNFLLSMENNSQRDSRSSGAGDTIHVKHYDISVDTIDFSTKTIRAVAQLNIQSRMNGVNNITLSLLKLQINSIKKGALNLAYTYDDTTLRITPPSVLNLNDTIVITISYQGAPQMDPSGWGGFYFSGSYAFNLGVGFEANPHVFGRAWFPCIDEFTDRATYDFHITASSSNKAFCNGVLQSSVDNGDGTTTWNWKLNQTIPTYLACMAVAPFYTINRTYSGVPVQWGVLPADSTKTLNTFGNIGTAVSTFISDYGAYPWGKIGFVMTPVVYGGMEHATSIHISKTFIDGSKIYETLWAHELSHMWWGDKVTCDKQEEMWLNEGWATFNEHIFTEAVYGNAAYKSSFLTDHREVLQLAHLQDGSYLPLNNVPFAYTYATLSVYVKGALIAHTLRNYMGDAKFFAACKAYLNNHAYGNANSYDMRDDFTASSGMDMSAFFDDWVYTPGFPHFSIDSVKAVPNGSDFDVTVYTRQRSKGNTHTYKMLAECTFADTTNDTTFTFLIDAPTNSFTVTIPFSPVWTALDRAQKMMDANTDYEMTITGSGTKTFTETNTRIYAYIGTTGTTQLRIENNWVAPDGFKNPAPKIRISDYHYWTVDGILSPTFRANATFTYDGSAPLPADQATSGYIDNTLITFTEDSLVMLYRKNPGEDWQAVNGFTVNKGASATDKKGTITVDTLKKGEYAFGYYDFTTGIASQNLSADFNLKAYPNPVSGVCTINFRLPRGENGRIRIYDLLGREIYQTQIFPHQEFITWDTYGRESGIYLVQMETDHHPAQTAKVILAK